MDQITDVGIGTAIICLGIYFVILFFQYVARRVWAATPNKIVRGIIKWVGTMWLPLWPIALGAVGVRYIPNIPVPDMIKNLSPEPGITWTIYGAFCGMICMAVVKGIKQALEKKGISLDMPDLKQAKLALRNDDDKSDVAEEEESEEKSDSEKPKKGMKRIRKSDKPEPEPEDEDDEDDDEEEESGKSKKD
jgi:hypothetical protein